MNQPNGQAAPLFYNFKEIAQKVHIHQHGNQRPIRAFFEPHPFVTKAFCGIAREVARTRNVGPCA